MNLAKKGIQLAEQYADSPFIRALVQYIPFGIGSSLDAGVTGYIQQFREERAKEFFDELAKGTQHLTSEIIENDDFIFRFLATFMASQRARRLEKVQNFAKLLKASILKEHEIEADDFEDFGKILEELTYREFGILVLLDDFENRNPPNPNENDLQRSNRYWENFKQALIEGHGVMPDEIDAALIRLQRTGCYETFTGAYIGYTGGQGKITATFRRMRATLQQS